MSGFNYIQTFYVNPQTVANAPEVMLTSIDVFFKAKPVRGATVSGAVAPTVNAWICEVENDSPLESRQILNSMTLIEYDLINTSQDASAVTVIGFPNPVRLATGKHYGLVLKFNDPGFDVWQNVLGDRLVTDGQITNTLSILHRFSGALLGHDQARHILQSIAVLGLTIKRRSASGSPRLTNA